MRPTFLAIATASLLLAGCGSTRVVTVLARPSHVTSAPRHLPATAPVADFDFALPRAAHQNQCAVSNQSAEIIFYSQPLEVARLCAAQITVPGWSSGFQTATSTAPELQYCYLRNAAATVVASVLDTSPGAAGARTCAGLIATRDWFEAQAHPTLCRVPGTHTTLREPPGSTCGSGGG